MTTKRLASLGFYIVLLIYNQLHAQNIGLYQSTLEPYQNSCKFSKALSTAGDVNLDGYDDIAVGAYNYDNGQTNEGRVYLFNGSVTGVQNTASWTFECDQASAQLGYDVRGGKDINNDGYSDLIVSANLFDNGQTDEGKVYMFLGSATGFPIVPSWTFESNNATATLGNSIDFAGDVNNDGYEDVIVGAMNYDMAVNEGKVFVFYGSADGLPATPSWEKFGYASNRYMGTLVSAAGDINNDSYDDVAIIEKVSTYTHRIYLFNGSATGLNATYSWNKDVPKKPTDIEAGDLNNDGYDDIVIGCPDENEGTIYCYNGSETGLSLTLSWKKTGRINLGILGYALAIEDVDNDGFLDLAANDCILKEEVYVFSDYYHDVVNVYPGRSDGIDTINYYSVEHKGSTYNFGYSIDFADHNGDGYADLLIGNPDSQEYTTFGGSVSVVNSSAMGLFGGEHNFFHGLEGDSHLGGAIEYGDINNDGYSDLVTSARGYSNDPEGMVVVMYGGENYLNGLPQNLPSDSTWESAFNEYEQIAVGDINGDGYDDVIYSYQYFESPENNEGIVVAYSGSAGGVIDTPMWQAESNIDDGNWGRRVESGDFNNDGYDDVVILKGWTDYALLVFNGGPSGPGSAPDWVFEASSESFTSLDFNGDGYDDLVITDGSYDTPLGKVAIFNGGPGGLSPAPTQMYDDPEEVGSYSGLMVSYGHDINGDGYLDFIVSSQFYEHGNSDEGALLFFYGSVAGTLNPVIFESNDSYSRFGELNAGIGDINADGYADVLASNFDPYELRLFYGSAAGVDTSYCVVLTHAYSSIAGTGDLNNDGYADFAIGNELFFAYGTLNETGSVLVYYGGLTFTDETYCNIPTGTVVAFVSPAGAGINWDNSPDINEFIIRWKKTLDAIWNYDTTFVSNYFLSDIESCATYQFQVRTNCAANESGWTALTTFASNCTDICEPVTGLTVDSTLLANIYVSWEPAVIGEGYIIEYKRTDLAVWQTLFVTTSSAAITPVTYCKDYEIRVRTVCSEDTSDYSTSVFTETHCTSCYSAPDDLFVTNITPSSAKIHWDADPDPDSYKLYYRETGTVAWTKKNTTTNVKKITGLLPATTYDYKIKTFCAGGISTAFSVTSTFTTLPLRENEVQQELFAFSIFPNPATDEISILMQTTSDKKVIIEITSMSGAVVMLEEMNYQELISIQTELSPGAYILTISQGGERSNQMLIIQ